MSVRGGESSGMDFSRQTAHDWFSIACTISSCGCSACNSRTIPWTEQTRQHPHHLSTQLHLLVDTNLLHVKSFPWFLQCLSHLASDLELFHLQSYRLVRFPGGLGWSQCQPAPVYLRNTATLHSPQQRGLRSRPLRKSLGRRSFGAPG